MGRLDFYKKIDNYLKKGKLKKARKLTENCIKRYPFYTPLYSLLAQILLKRNEVSAAKNVLKLALEQDPSDITAMKLLFKIAEDEKDEELKETLTPKINFLEEKVLTEEVPPPFYTPTIAELYESQGYYREALEIYQKLLKMDPKEVSFFEKIEELKKKIGESQT